jgi:hypothetical protein
MSANKLPIESVPENFFRVVAGLDKDSLLNLCHRLVQALHDGTYETPYGFDDWLQDKTLLTWVSVLGVAVDQLKVLDWEKCGLEEEY